MTRSQRTNFVGNAMTDSAEVDFQAVQFMDMEADQAVQALIRHAVEVKASDLFLLTESRSVTLSVRRHGVVERVSVVPPQLGKHMISYIKAAAGMDITENRRPADGRWIAEFDDLHVDLRINTITTLHGEDVSMRIWDRSVGLLTLDDLGIPKRDLSTFRSMMACPSGLVLVTGPTGTGKTTTLYAALNHLSDGTRKINTLEDPVEYQLESARQSQVNPKIGLDFPELLRSVLRQSPDVVMVGEIRDEETAATAVRAASSGHLVFATMHAPVAASAVQSMLALGVRPYFLSNCLLGVIAQRLVRTLCPMCRVHYDISDSPQTFEDVQDLLGENEGQSIFGPSGCDECFGVGYAGRTGLFEVMTMNQEIRGLIAASATTKEIEQAAIRNGMIEFRRSAMLKVAQGITSTEEILRDVPAEYLGLES